MSIESARFHARTLLRRFGVQRAEHVNVEAFAMHLGARLLEARLDGATAQLVRVGDVATILVSDRITDIGARRFSIAHELGHLILKHESLLPEVLCAPPARTRASRTLEREASSFAAELLMPSYLLSPRCRTARVNLDIPWQIAREFNVSILASARQFAALASERCAAVFSAAGKVVWVEASKSFDADIPIGRPLDHRSLASAFFDTGLLEDSPHVLPADTWIDAGSDLSLIEHSHGSSWFRTVLSLLWIRG
jgi:hypothetical protein